MEEFAFIFTLIFDLFEIMFNFVFILQRLHQFLFRKVYGNQLPVSATGFWIQNWNRTSS